MAAPAKSDTVTWGAGKAAKAPPGSRSEPTNLVELIHLVRPKAALLGTFTFSPAYFDAVLLPAFRECGCREIVVLVDAAEAARSAQEGRSRHAGRAYRVCSVHAPMKGFFHPKFALLKSDGGLALSVASGNLTASGLALQLECFDAVSGAEEPDVLAEFAAWCDRLGAELQGLSEAATSALKGGAVTVRKLLAEQDKAAGRPLEGTGLVRLIHTLGSTPAAQIQALFNDHHPQARSLTVLSPFHAPDGAPVFALADGVGAGKVRIGVCEARRAAPFDGKRLPSDRHVSYVLPNRGAAPKPLHAKVFEIQAAFETLVVSGSVNATAQSLASEENIELALARWLARSPFKWTKFKPETFVPTGMAHGFMSVPELYVEAQMLEDGTVHARLLPALTEAVQLEILRGGEVLYAAMTQPDPTGSIDISASALAECTRDLSSSLLLQVRAGQRVAICWLNLDLQLRLSEQEREGGAALNRVLSGGFDTADVLCVLDMVAAAIQALGAGQEVGKSAKATVAGDPETPDPGGPGEASGAAGSDEVFDYASWQRSGNMRRSSFDRFMYGRQPDDLLKALQAFMQRDLADTHGSIGEDPVADTRGVGSGHPGRSGGQVPREPAPLLERNPGELLDAMCVAISDILCKDATVAYAAVLVEISASRALHRLLRQDSLSVTAAQSWIQRYSRYRYLGEDRHAVMRVGSALASLVVVRDPSLASTLREGLEKMAAGRLDLETLDQFRVEGLLRPCFALVPPLLREESALGPSLIVRAATPDDRVQALLLASRNRPYRPGAEAEGYAEVARYLREQWVSKERLIRGVFRPRPDGAAACPHCGGMLRDHEVQELRQKHALVRRDCGTLVLYSETPKRLERFIREMPGA